MIGQGPGERTRSDRMRADTGRPVACFAMKQASAVTQISGVTPASAASAAPPPMTNPLHPVMPVPTQPLSPAVLAELIGRQLSFYGSSGG